MHTGPGQNASAAVAPGGPVAGAGASAGAGAGGGSSSGGPSSALGSAAAATATAAAAAAADDEVVVVAEEDLDKPRQHGLAWANPVFKDYKRGASPPPPFVCVLVCVRLCADVGGGKRRCDCALVGIGADACACLMSRVTHHPLSTPVPCVHGGLTVCGALCRSCKRLHHTVLGRLARSPCERFSPKCI